MPKSKTDQLTNGLKEIEKAFKKAVAENKQRDQHILYELRNHEAFYTCDIEDTLDALGSDYTHEEVMQVYNKNKEFAS